MNEPAVTLTDWLLTLECGAFAQAARAGAALSLLPAGCARAPGRSEQWVNDVHSGLNRTRVARIERPDSPEALRAALARAGREGLAVSVAAGRHAMGGQQFGADTVLVDTSALRRVVELDLEAGQVEAEAGIQWPELVDELLRRQAGRRVGDRAEADRRRPVEPGWGALRQRPRSRSRAAAAGGRRGGVHADGRLRRAPAAAAGRRTRSSSRSRSAATGSSA
jgi:FAD/FMN-containing dehydrogenase